MNKIKFHILEERDGKATFRAIEGEAIEIEGLHLFVCNDRPPSQAFDSWKVYDKMSGMRAACPCATREAAIADFTSNLADVGVSKYSRLRQHYLDLYGKPPAPLSEEIEVISGPNPITLEDFEPCRSERS